MTLIKMIDFHLEKAINKLMLKLGKNIINYKYNDLVDILGIIIYFININFIIKLLFFIN